MSNYNIAWTSNGAQGIPGKGTIVLLQKTLDTTSTSLTLTGKGINNYGEIQQENYIRLMEHFASSTPPPNPTIGQLWFNTAESILYVRVDPTNPVNFGIPLYYPQSPAAWAQMYPTVQSVSGFSDFGGSDGLHGLAAQINKILGAPQGTGSSAYGWGQTDLVPQYTSPAVLAPGFDPTVYPSQFDNNAWAILISRLRKAQRMLGLPEYDSSYGFISDGRPNAASLPFAHQMNDYTGVLPYGTKLDVAAGFGGQGVTAIQANFTALQSQIAALDAARFALPLTNVMYPPVVQTLTSYTRATPTTSGSYQYAIQVLFASQAAAQAYFNSGSVLRIFWSLTSTTPTDPLNSNWTALLAKYNELHLGYQNLSLTGVPVNNYANAIGAPTTPQSIGFYGLTSSTQTIFLRGLEDVTSGGAYDDLTHGGGIVIDAYTQVVGSAFAVNFNITFDITSTPYPGSLNGPLIAGVAGLWPSQVNMDAPYFSTTAGPGVSLITTTGSGTFATGGTPGGADTGIPGTGTGGGGGGGGGPVTAPTITLTNATITAGSPVIIGSYTGTGNTYTVTNNGVPFSGLITYVGGVITLDGSNTTSGNNGHTFAITATNGGGSASSSMVLTVTASVSPVTILENGSNATNFLTGRTIINDTVNYPTSSGLALTITGGTAPYFTGATVSSGSLPPGVSLVVGGGGTEIFMSGTPTSAGSFTAGVFASYTDGASSGGAAHSVTANVQQATHSVPEVWLNGSGTVGVPLTNIAAPAAVFGQSAYSGSTNGPFVSPVLNAVFAAGTMPPGVTLSTNGTNAYTYLGTPTTAGTYTFQINASGNDEYGNTFAQSTIVSFVVAP